MSLIATFLYSKFRKVLFRKATKKDPIISRIMLLEEFENIILAIDEIEEFYDAKNKYAEATYQSSQVDFFSQTRKPSDFLFEIFEKSFSPIVKLPKLTCDFLDIKTIINSSLTYIIAESQDTELQLNISSTFPQNEVHLTNTIADSQVLEKISLPNVNLPKARFSTCAVATIETRTGNQPLNDIISDLQEIKLQLDCYPQDEVHLTNIISDSPIFDDSIVPIVRLPKTDIISDLQEIKLQLDCYPQDEVHLTNIISDSPVFGDSIVPIVKLPKTDIITDLQDIKLQLDCYPQDEEQLTNIIPDLPVFDDSIVPIVKLPKTRFSTHTDSPPLTDIISDSQDNELQKAHLTTSITKSQITETKSSFSESNAKKENAIKGDFGGEVLMKNVLTPYLTSLYNNNNTQVQQPYGYYNNYDGYGQCYNSNCFGYYQPQYQIFEPDNCNKIEIKKGDWFCSDCFQHNFAKRNRCYFCQVDRSDIVNKLKCVEP